MGFSLWEGFARGARGRAHQSILSVAEEWLSRSLWTGKDYRDSSPEEKSRITFHVAGILARIVAEDYRRAQELGVPLHELGTKPRRFRRPRKMREDRAQAIIAVGNLRDEEVLMEQYRDGSEAFEASGDEGHRDDHESFRHAQESAAALRHRLKLDG